MLFGSTNVCPANASVKLSHRSDLSRSFGGKAWLSELNTSPAVRQCGASE
jgi:hypothetical protein